MENFVGVHCIVAITFCQGALHKTRRRRYVRVDLCVEIWNETGIGHGDAAIGGCPSLLFLRISKSFRTLAILILDSYIVSFFFYLDRRT